METLAEEIPTLSAISCRVTFFLRIDVPHRIRCLILNRNAAALQEKRNLACNCHSCSLPYKAYNYNLIGLLYLFEKRNASAKIDKVSTHKRHYQQEGGLENTSYTPGVQADEGASKHSIFTDYPHLSDIC
ncbi:MAG: hypothetical protein GX626_08100 [Spirochaetales bacterium]|nr:hypothetical protein [Spirochaetales bacterium]